MVKKKKVLLLCDGDMIAFSHCAAEEYGKEPEDISFAKIQMSMESKMDFMMKRIGATETVTLISGDSNMRHIICPAYKANRDGVWRPENLRNAKATLMTSYDGLKCDYLEADDLIGIMCRNKVELEMGKRGNIKSIKTVRPLTKDDYDEIWVASLDKDLKQIGGREGGPVIKHYRWETGTTGEKIEIVSGFGELRCIIKDNGKTKKKEIKGNGPKFFLWQCLTGDSTDGVMGCGISETKIFKSGAKCGQEYQKRVGVGAVEAFELLDKIDNYADGLKAVATQYVMRFADGWQEQLLINGRLLYMSNTVAEGNKVRLWHHKGVTEYFDLNSKQIVSA
ncbi:5'-3' exonuclease [Erwinia phage Papaline]|nr:5'-3' exonuclease [Erwinia phage Papaline]